MTTDILTVRNLRVSLLGSQGTLPVIRGFEINVPPSAVVGVLGESGSGKTVSVRSLLGLLDERIFGIDSGSAFFEGQDLLKISKPELRGILGSRISYVFQDPAKTLNPNIAVGRQLEMTLKCHGFNNTRERALGAMKSAGLDSPESLYLRRPSQLSGGQCQRVMIAQAVETEPKLIVADEPTSSIDAGMQKIILDLFSKLNKDTGTALIVITHNFDVVRYMCRYVVVMYGGLVMESGRTDEVMDKPAHPYTRDLIRCAESLGNTEESLYTLEGRPPTLQEFDLSCPFRKRCGSVIQECSGSTPELIEKHGRKIRCYNPLSEPGLS